MVPRVGQFANAYKDLPKEWKQKTPILFCEGDSWFSTPLAMNLLDQLVWPPKEIEQSGPPVFGAGGLFFRAEESGHQASANPRDPSSSMFVPKNITKLRRWYKRFDFDLVLVSAGGNDFVAEFLDDTFKNDTRATTPQQAFNKIVRSGRYKVVRDAYTSFLTAFFNEKPNVPIIAHSYDYPRLLGKRAEFTPANLGAAALFIKGTGPWIGDRIDHVMPDVKDQRAFAQMMIDGFVENVLEPLEQQFPLFDFVDLRMQLNKDALWFDEMHPTSEGFEKLAERLRLRVHNWLPKAKGGLR
jgi:hypothetical protein